MYNLYINLPILLLQYFPIVVSLLKPDNKQIDIKIINLNLKKDLVTYSRNRFGQAVNNKINNIYCMYSITII